LKYEISSEEPLNVKEIQLISIIHEWTMSIMKQDGNCASIMKTLLKLNGFRNEKSFPFSNTRQETANTKLEMLYFHGRPPNWNIQCIMETHDADIFETGSLLLYLVSHATDITFQDKNNAIMLC
jgi:hypothetical protein